MDRLKRFVKEEAMLSRVALSMRAEIPSGPLALDTHAKIIISLLQSSGHPPDLPTLHRFPVKNRFIDIAAKIGTDYELFGTFLLQDKDRNKVKTIERSERGDPLRITVEILRQWLQGNGKLPVNWQTLIQCMPTGLKPECCF